MARPTGRPRVSGASPTGLGTRKDILAAGARLFCSEGYGSTSTHALAKAAGIRQASVYHYFSGKHEVLLELLLGTVQPSLDAAARLLALPDPPEHRLWALCVSDVRLLTGGEENVGSLYLLPELGDERFAPFHERRSELETAYRTLVAACGVRDVARASALVLGLVESVILQRRRAPESIDDETAFGIADAALRVLDVDPGSVRRAREAGAVLLSEIAATPSR
jgi:AcrR family transcriptional regulator